MLNLFCEGFKIAPMRQSFLNREDEKRAFSRLLERPGLGVLTGRRRIGKSRFLRELASGCPALFTQAIEADRKTQIQQICRDWPDVFGDSRILPEDWDGFFELLTLKLDGSGIKLLVLDEFPWLAASDPSLPSILQRWVDHQCERVGVSLICAGSSQRMMHSHFLDGTAPLYGRATVVHKMKPLAFKYLLELHGWSADPEAFEAYSIMGGVPRYWLLGGGEKDPVKLADDLFFEDNAILADEPIRLLWDEGLSGQLPKNILELVGRGNHKPSRIASRLGVTQGSLGRPLGQLCDAGYLEREVSFGEPSRSPKRVLYRLSDPALRFWYSVYSPNRQVWNVWDSSRRARVVHEFASTVWEDLWREALGGCRYWDAQSEFDVVSPTDDPGAVEIAEVKWSALTEAQKARLRGVLEAQWRQSKLSSRYRLKAARVVSQEDLGELVSLG